MAILSTLPSNLPKRSLKIVVDTSLQACYYLDMTNNEMSELFGEPISIYTRAQAIEDGFLVNMTEWASATTGFIGGFTCPVAVTSNLWAAIERKTTNQDTRGRAHDVLFMSSLALRAALAQGREERNFEVFLRIGRKSKQILHVVTDGDGVTIGFPEDF